LVIRAARRVEGSLGSPVWSGEVGHRGDGVGLAAGDLAAG